MTSPWRKVTLEGELRYNDFNNKTPIDEFTYINSDIGIGGTALTLALLILIPQMGLTVSAAYASNIFGILCVAIVKIFHVRRSREQLIHEAQS